LISQLIEKFYFKEIKLPTEIKSGRKDESSCQDSS